MNKFWTISAAMGLFLLAAQLVTSLVILHRMPPQPLTFGELVRARNQPALHKQLYDQMPVEKSFAIIDDFTPISVTITNEPVDVRINR